MGRALALLAAWIPMLLFAQGGVGLRGSWGWLSPHHVHMWYLVERHAIAGEVFYQRAFSGRKPWHHDYKDPSWGIGLMTTDAGSPELIGRVIRLLPYYDLPLFAEGRTTVAFRFGWGLGSVEHPHDQATNNQQTAIGSRTNAAVLFALEVRRRIGRYHVGADLALDHLSNASMVQPNLGINLVTVGLSVRCAVPGPRPLPMPRDTMPSWRRGRTTELILAWGTQEVESYEGTRAPVLSAAASMLWRISPKSSFGFGFDLFNKEVLRVKDPELHDAPWIDLTQVGAHGSYRLHFGGMAIVVEQGVYLYTPVEEEIALYQRLGMRQDLTSHLAAGLSLKTHFGAADHFELGLGYRF